MSDSSRPFGQMTRRHWMGHLASTALGVPAIQFFSSLEANAQQLRKTNRSCIVLWMGGGPSHLDIWDLKPDSEKNGGPFKPIDTSAPGVKITRASAQGGQADASSEHHSLARFQGREPRSRHLHDAHRLCPQPDGRAPGLRLVLRAGAGREAVELRPAALHLDQLARGRRRLPGHVVRPVRRAEPERADRQSAAAQGRRRTGGWSGGCTCSTRSRTSSSASVRLRRPSITRRSTPKRCG